MLFLLGMCCLYSILMNVVISYDSQKSNETFGIRERKEYIYNHIGIKISLTGTTY